MLDACCPEGYRAEQSKKQEFWIVHYQGKTYWRLPAGEHGKRANPEIQAGHVKKMCNFFGIRDCAKKRIPRLR